MGRRRQRTNPREEAKTPRQERHIRTVYGGDERGSDHVADGIRDGEDLTAFLVACTPNSRSAGPFFSDDIRAVSVQSRDAQFLSIPQFLHAIDEGDLKLRSELQRSNHRQTEVVAISGLPVRGSVSMATHSTGSRCEVGRGCS